MSGFASERLSVLSCGSTFLFCASTMLFHDCSFVVRSEVREPDSIFFFLKIVSAVGGVFCVSIHILRFFCSSSVKNAIGNLIEIAL